eukprot:3574375-Rhodomonas_salina.1
MRASNCGGRLAGGQEFLSCLATSESMSLSFDSPALATRLEEDTTRSSALALSSAEEDVPGRRGCWWPGSKWAIASMGTPTRVMLLWAWCWFLFDLRRASVDAEGA